MLRCASTLTTVHTALFEGHSGGCWFRTHQPSCACRSQMCSLHESQCGAGMLHHPKTLATLHAHSLSCNSCLAAFEKATSAEAMSALEHHAQQFLRLSNAAASRHDAKREEPASVISTSAALKAAMQVQAPPFPSKRSRALLAMDITCMKFISLCLGPGSLTAQSLGAQLVSHCFTFAQSQAAVLSRAAV